MAPRHSTPPPGNIDVRFKGQHNGRLTVQGTLHIDAPADLIYDMISDYEKAPEIFENISASTSYTEGDYVEVRQLCTWRFLIFNGTFELVLGVTENPSDRELIFKLRKSKFMRDFEGRWQVRSLSDNACLVTHTLSVTPQPPPPEAIADVTSKIFMRQVRGILRDLQNGVVSYGSETHLT